MTINKSPPESELELFRHHDLTDLADCVRATMTFAYVVRSLWRSGDNPKDWKYQAGAMADQDVISSFRQTRRGEICELVQRYYAGPELHRQAMRLIPPERVEECCEALRFRIKRACTEPHYRPLYRTLRGLLTNY